MQVRQIFAVRDVYYAALLGGIVGYFGFLALVALSVLVVSGQIGEVLNVFLMGFIVGIGPAALGSALIVAPLGVLIAMTALGRLPQSPWHGAITGVLTAIIITIGLAAFLGGEWHEAPDAGTFAFLVGALGIAAITGWLTQRRFLRMIARG